MEISSLLNPTTPPSNSGGSGGGGGGSPSPNQNPGDLTLFNLNKMLT
jgi:hypothetical protein